MTVGSGSTVVTSMAMDHMSGHTNSQTWQAWLESYQVLWNNTSWIFLASVGVSLMVVFITWMTNRTSSLPDATVPCQAKEELEEYVGKPQEKDEEAIKLEKRDVDEVMQYSQHLPEQVKKAQHRSLEKSIHTQLNEEQRAAEREAQSQQLAAIFKMMQEQEEKFGETTMDEIKDQMKLYCG